MPVVSTDGSCAERVECLRALIDEKLAQLVPEAEPAALYDPVRYVLAGQGKRLRPTMLLLTAGAFGVDTERALPAALAIEVFHNFTLVHDDIMDNADARRGQATVHVRWDEATAILCGDYLMALSYDLLTQVDHPRLPQMLRTYHQMVARLCEGQALDKVFERRTDVGVEEYLHMIGCKTGALLECAFELGGLIGAASEEEMVALQTIGRKIGRGFQIQDDLLDLVADDARWGKVIGGDLIEGKKTFLLLRALERAEGDEHRWFHRVVRDGGLPAHEVPEAHERMAQLGVLDEAREAALDHVRAAKNQVDRLPQAPATDVLRWLIGQLQARLH